MIAVGAVLDAGVGHLGGLHGVGAGDIDRIDDAEKRMNSLPWLMAICFSPDTSRLPLGSTSMTVVVMVPVKVLLAAASPLPPNLLASEAVASRPAEAASGSLSRRRDRGAEGERCARRWPISCRRRSARPG